MSGIIVGVDGSGHSQRALKFAMKEAVIRHMPLTVLTVHEAVRGYYSGAAIYPDDPIRTEEARSAAQAETDKVLAGPGPHLTRSRSRSRRFTASRSRSSSTRAGTRTCWSWARGARAVSPG